MDSSKSMHNKRLSRNHNRSWKARVRE